MKGTPCEEPATGAFGGKGIGRGRFGLEVADVGKGGKEMVSLVIPGINRTTTFCTARGFCTRLAPSWVVGHLQTSAAQDPEYH